MPKYPWNWLRIMRKSEFIICFAEVQERIVNIVKEIITKYDVDGIHMDDYFYPSLEASETMNDGAEFQKYGKDKFKNVEDFRRNNVNTVV